MKLRLIREIKTDLSSIGRLYINDKYFCKTLEPFDAGLDEHSTLADIYEAKHARKCAIPTGNYTICMNQVSPRFGRLAPYSDFGGIVPRYEGVKGFAGVLMHIGNFPKDTDGCTLVGRYDFHGCICYLRTINIVCECTIQYYLVTCVVSCGI